MDKDTDIEAEKTLLSQEAITDDDRLCLIS
jgi:hypothetical protein